MADEPKKNKLDLNVPTLVAGAGATVTMSVLGSYLGPTGTMSGMAITSVATGVVSAVWKKAALDANERARQVALNRFRGKARPTAADRAEFTRALDAAMEASENKVRWTNRRLFVAGAVAAVGLFGGVALAETGVEAVAGRPVAAIVQGKQGHGTTFGGGAVGARTPTPRSTATTNPDPSRGTTSTTVTPTQTPSVVPSTGAPLPSARVSVPPLPTPNGPTPSG